MITLLSICLYLQFAVFFRRTSDTGYRSDVCDGKAHIHTS